MRRFWKNHGHPACAAIGGFTVAQGFVHNNPVIISFSVILIVYAFYRGIKNLSLPVSLNK